MICPKCGNATFQVETENYALSTFAPTPGGGNNLNLGNFMPLKATVCRSSNCGHVELNVDFAALQRQGQQSPTP